MTKKKPNKEEVQSAIDDVFGDRSEHSLSLLKGIIAFIAFMTLINVSKSLSVLMGYGVWEVFEGFPEWTMYANIVFGGTLLPCLFLIWKLKKIGVYAIAALWSVNAMLMIFIGIWWAVAIKIFQAAVMFLLIRPVWKDFS